MNKEIILKLLQTYGYGTKEKDPYLYEGTLGYGIVYTFKSSFYGTLTRLFIGKTKEEYEDFLRKYTWYRKNGAKAKVLLTLSNYKEINSKPMFMFNGEDKTYEKLQLLEQDKNENSLKEKNYLKKLKRTYYILLQIMDVKRKLQMETRKNYIDFLNNYVTKKNDFNKKLSDYLKDPFAEEKVSLPSVIDDLKETEINKYHKELNANLGKEELEGFIYAVTHFIKELEIDEEYLKNKYELIRLPLKINEIKEKDKILESYKKKLALFSKKEKILNEFKEIENQSTLKNIVTYKHYKENEEKRINEKYAMIPDLDFRTIGDFLAEFDNIKFEEMTFTTEEKEKYSFEEIMEEVENDYQNRNKEEQDYLVGYSYLYTILKTKRVSDFYTILRNPNNVMVRVKYFQDIDFSSENKCELSIRKYLKKIQTLFAYPLIGDLNVFFIGDKVINEEDFLKASSKKAQAPRLGLGDEVTYVCNLKKDVAVYFLPGELKEDIYNEGSLILSQDRSLFLIRLKDLIIKKEKEDILKVVQYEMEKTSKDGFLIAQDYKSKKVSLFQKVSLERKEG